MDAMNPDIAETIQLALAPAFLLVAMGQFLILTANRLARVVDRARDVAAQLPAEPKPEDADCIAELKALDRRMIVVNGSIYFSVMAMIAVCLVVASLFVARFTAAEMTWGIAIAFVVSMVLLIVALLLFLWEVRLAGASIHVRSDLVGRK